MSDDELHKVMPFGKYKGVAIIDVIRKDPNYILWAMSIKNNFKPSTEIANMAKRQAKKKPKLWRPKRVIFVDDLIDWDAGADYDSTA